MSVNPLVNHNSQLTIRIESGTRFQSKSSVQHLFRATLWLSFRRDDILFTSATDHCTIHTIGGSLIFSLGLRVPRNFACFKCEVLNSLFSFYLNGLDSTFNYMTRRDDSLVNNISETGITFHFMFVCRKSKST